MKANPKPFVREPIAIRKSGHKGTSLVEFALILPLFLLLLCGLIQFGFLFHANLQLTQACSLATRYATFGKSDTEIQEKVSELLNPNLPLPNTSPVVVEITRDYVPHGDRTVSVTVTYDYPISLPLLDFLFPEGNARLQSSSIMRSEQ